MFIDDTPAGGSTSQQVVVMPRKPRTPKPEEVKDVEAFEKEVASLQPMTAQEIVAQVAESTKMPDVFDAVIEQRESEEKKPGRWEKAVAGMTKRFGGGRDEVQGVRVDFESEPKVGLPYARVLVTFADDKRPNAEERQLLKDNGFKFSGDSWQARRTAGNQELALRLVHDIKKGRGEEGRNFYI